MNRENVKQSRLEFEMERTVKIKNVQATEAELRAALAELEKPSVVDGKVHSTTNMAAFRMTPCDSESIYFDTPNFPTDSVGCWWKKRDIDELIAALQAAQKEMGWV